MTGVQTCALPIYRNMIDEFAQNEAIQSINEKISAASTVMNGKLSLSADQGVQNSWESSLVTQVDGIPFAHAGKGAQCIICLLYTSFAYMNLIEHWGSGIPRIIDKVKAAGLREPEFIGGEVDLRINIYRGQVDTNNAIINANGTKNGTKNGANGVKCGVDDGTNSAEVPLNKEQTQIEKLLQIIEKNPSATQALSLIHI